MMGTVPIPKHGRVRAGRRVDALVHQDRAGSSSTAKSPSSSTAGENLPVHREPIDSTFYEPNVIVAPAARGAQAQAGPADLRRRARRPVERDAAGAQRREDLEGADSRAAAPAGQGRIRASSSSGHAEVPARRAHDAGRHRHCRRMLFGPFGDIYRHDKRTPFVAEGYVDIHPSGRQGARRRRRRLRLDRLRPRGPAVPRLAEEQARLRSSRGCPAGPATTPARRAG